jgi:hypothetical protein
MSNEMNFRTGNTTFTSTPSSDDVFPPMNTKSRYLFGNELEPFMIELGEDLMPTSRRAPLAL